MTAFSSKRDLSGLGVAFLATDGFEESELFEPLEALQRAGARTTVISLPDTPGAIRGETAGEAGDEIEVDDTVDQASAEDFDALVLPGGRRNAEGLRRSEDALGFVRDFLSNGRPVAAICHGPWVIAAAGEAEGRTLTSYPMIRADLEAAGAEWADEAIVVDGTLVTSRGPADLEAFVEEILDVL